MSASHTRYLVRIVAWTEASTWVCAESPEEAQRLAEDEYLKTRGRNFATRDTGIDFSEIEDKHIIAGNA